MIVRYADDFKLFCKTHEQAVKIYYATKQWLKERLKLDVSEEKTKIVNLKTEYSEFLGFKLNKWVLGIVSPPLLIIKSTSFNLFLVSLKGPDGKTKPLPIKRLPSCTIISISRLKA